MKLILAVCLLVWGCQGTKNNFLRPNKWLGTFLNSTNNRVKDCNTEKNETGQCVKMSECLDRKVIDLEMMDTYRIKSCPYLKICCPNSRLVNGTLTPPPMPKKRPGCGWSNPGGYIFRDSSKTHAEFGEFPWMVALMRKVNQNQVWHRKDYLGGGTLIHHSVVMTIAHSLKDIKEMPFSIKCRLGEWDTQNTNEIYPHQDRDVTKIISHEEFSTRTLENDIALVFTTLPFDLTDPHVGIACLSFNEPSTDTNCLSMGWGKDFNSHDQYAVWLKKVPLPIVDHGKCEHDLQQTRLGPGFNLHKTLICAGGRKGFDTCKGDGGSSLVCRTSSDGAPTRYSVYGMVSFGVECGTELAAGYVNVAAMSEWITDKFAENKLDLPFIA
ncbi:phenoloxidase-activating factor 2-like [Pieris rapae]|uniref:phenoloxidase-activating factor 2-like n=1 Tax=Pieris rapae TaxID=64459 RepID=UPI001E27E10F|nr:phenoloxidase-activating factor 2-like [Pieris rapae]